MNPFANRGRWLRAALLAASALLAPGVHAQLSVKDAWVRGTVAQQKATGMFAQLVSATGGRLVGAASPVAGVVEIHEMTMEGNIMRMRAVDAIALPAGKTVELKPGGYHVMLMELRQPLKAGDVVAVTLVFEGAGGRRETVEVKAPVRPLNAAAGSSGHSGHSGHKH